MKKTKKMVTAVFMSLLLVMVGVIGLIAPSSGRSAFADVYSGEDVYYIYDMYPSVQNDIEAAGYSVCTKYVSEMTFGSAFSDGEFEEVCIIFDFKSFVPDLDLLRSLIFDLQGGDCVFILLSRFDGSVFSGVVEYFDFAEFNIGLNRYYSFVGNALNIIIQYYIDWGEDIFSNCSVILDNLTPVYFLDDFTQIYEYASEEFRYVIDGLAPIINDSANQLSFNSQHGEHVEELSYNCSLLNSFIYLSGRSLSFCYKICGDPIAPIDSDPFESQYVFAICISPFTEELYDKLLAAQEDGKNVFVFVFEAEPLVYGDGGLQVITDGDLLDGDYFEDVSSEAIAEILDILDDLLSR